MAVSETLRFPCSSWANCRHLKPQLPLSGVFPALCVQGSSRHTVSHCPSITMDVLCYNACLVQHISSLRFLQAILAFFIHLFCLHSTASTKAGVEPLLHDSIAVAMSEAQRASHSLATSTLVARIKQSSGSSLGEQFCMGPAWGLHEVGRACRKATFRAWKQLSLSFIMKSNMACVTGLMAT